MLGEADDLAALQSLLDDLGAALEVSRADIDQMCGSADRLGGVVAPQGLVPNPGAVADEERALGATEQALSQSVKQLATVVDYMREYASVETLVTLGVHLECAQELDMWHTRVAKAQHELLELQRLETEVDAQLVQLVLRAQKL